MNPQITSLIEDDDTLKFTIENIDVSLLNSLRRVILSEIECFVFHTFPYNENKCDIYINTTRLNNEIIKQRLSCIPIHINDLSFPYEEYIVEVDKKNDTNNIIFVTTEDFKVKNISTGNYLKDKEVTKLFPPDKITNDYIQLARLRPQISDNIPGEQLKFSSTLSIGKAKDHAMYNVVSTCSYGNKMDVSKIDSIWKEKEKELKSGNKTDEEIEFEKKNWLLLDAKRIYVENSFDFTLETLGIYSNIELLYKACSIMIDKCKKFIKDLNDGKIKIKKNDDSTIDNDFIVTLINEDYTLGNILNYILYEKYYEKEKSITFIGFRKLHPHDKDSILRIALTDEHDITTLNSYLLDGAEMLIAFYNDLRVNFKID